MKFIKDIPEYRQMGNLFEHSNAVVFCGAGVSVEPPAGLPGWRKLRDYTLNAIAQKDESLAEYLTDITSIKRTTNSYEIGFTPEVVASQIAKLCPNYFECFRSLEQGDPNANHRYLAKIAKHGHLKYIITTNWDLFLEQALLNENIEYKVYRTEEEFTSFKKSDNQYSVHLFKLHGCISIPTTIIAAVEQEAKGLSFGKIAVLDELQSKFWFIFFGYSGADLKLNLDYLRMVSMKDKAKGFVWNFLKLDKNIESIPSEIDRLAKLYTGRAHLVYGKLPETFDALFFPLNRIQWRKYTLQERNSWQEEKDIKLQRALESWSNQYLDRPTTYQLFGNLLNRVGELDKALICYKKFASLCKTGQDDKRLATAFSKIGLIYQRKKIMFRHLFIINRLKK